MSELDELRKKAEEADELRASLKTTQKAFDDLKKRFDDHTKKFVLECKERNDIEKALQMSKLIVDRSPVILFRRPADKHSHLEYISENLLQFGYSPAEFISGERSYKDIVHSDDRERVKKEITEYANLDVEEYTQFYRCLTKSGDIRWVEDQTSVVRNDAGEKTHNQGILIDITKRKLVENALRKSEEKFRRIVETAAEGFFLMNESRLIIEVNNAFCRMLGYAREELIGKSPMDFATDTFRQFMHLNRETLLAQEYRESEGMVIAKSGRHIPVLIHGNTLRNDQGKNIGNMAFVTDMTEHKKALALAGEVQKSLLPHEKPLVKGLDIAGRNVSCDEIGGDYYDFLWRRESKRGPFSVVVGDISGHGVDSALLMTTARAFLRMRASQPGTISEVITAMNHHLAKDVLETGRFMTLFYLTIDPEQKSIDWVRAGHDPALLYDPYQDEFEELKGKGIALGVTDEFNYVQSRKTGLANGQILAIGTDGIWEAFNRQGEMFGKDRLRDVIRRKAGESASNILSAVYDELNQFTVGQKSEDDITLVVIKVDGLE
ncbi:MAG: SpoIIE family protein phosphatase [Desulfobulbaceae bacterium]|nr:SpoIIE family protein phosphatase [Desulfobulbaceae bacterium]